MKPSYDLDKIRYSIDAQTFKRAIVLYNSSKVTRFKSEPDGFSAVVLGGDAYSVYVSAHHFDQGLCDCYLGKNDTLCKHMVAVALRAVSGGRKISDKQAAVSIGPACSGRLGTLEKSALNEIKGAITAAMRCIKPYNGPSRIWFTYQSSLHEGCGRLATIVSSLPVSEASARILIDVLLRLDRKLCESGVDDSDGTVGGFMMDVVTVLLEFVKLDPPCSQSFHSVIGRRTCFEWEETLVRYLDEMPLH